MLTFELTEEQMQEAVFGLDSPGRCVECGEEVNGVEPDAREYRCPNPNCGELSVYGLEELLLMGQVKIVE